MSTRSTGLLLVAAFAVFLVGAGFWLVREFERPLIEMLRAVQARRRRWFWIHAWMFAGTLLGVVAVTSLVRLLREDGGGPVATGGLIAFVLGSLAFLVALVIRLAATPGAAAETVRTNAVPPAYVARHRLASAMHVTNMLLAYAAFAFLGSAMVGGGSLLPAWLGWTGVAAGVLGLIGFLLMRGGPFAPPIIAHSYGLVVGIVLLLQ